MLVDFPPTTIKMNGDSTNVCEYISHCMQATKPYEWPHATRLDFGCSPMVYMVLWTWEGHREVQTNNNNCKQLSEWIGIHSCWDIIAMADWCALHGNYLVKIQSHHSYSDVNNWGLCRTQNSAEYAKQWCLHVLPWQHEKKRKKFETGNCLVNGCNVFLCRTGWLKTYFFPSSHVC